jgi:competence protein ComEC
MKDEILRVDFLNVGQGDSVLITAPNLNQILVDTSKDQIVTRSLSEVLPYYDKELDAVLLTHADLDHIGGTPALVGKYDVKNVIYQFERDESALTEHIFDISDEHEINQIELSAGSTIILDDLRGVRLEVLWPFEDNLIDDKNEMSIVLRVEYGNTSFLLTGDIGKEVEQDLIEIYSPNKIETDVLKLGHHGSKTSTDPDFLATVSPDYVVVSAGEGNKFGHPHQEVLDTLEAFYETPQSEYLLQTKDGHVSFLSDGIEVWPAL